MNIYKTQDILKKIRLGSFTEGAFSTFDPHYVVIPFSHSSRKKYIDTHPRRGRLGSFAT